MNKKKNKRGQASVEYLGTYAWTFFALILTVGALSYFGVFDTDSYIPDTCAAGSQIECMDASLDSSETFYLQLKNNYAQEIIIEQLILTSFDDSYDTGSPTYTTSPQMRVLPGSTATITYPSVPATYDEGRKEEIEFVIRYRRYPNGVNHDVRGSAVAQIQDATTLASIGYCGDGTKNNNEECDAPTIGLSGYVGHDDCLDYQCLSNCKCESLCGNGIIDGVEAQSPNVRCDHAAADTGCLVGKTCNSDCYCV